MTDEVFLDTNLLLYACSNAVADATKRKVVQEIMLNSTFALSAQVLQEFIANALRKPQFGITEANIDATLQMAAMVRVQPITHELIIAAVIFRRKFSLSHGDATIVVAAQHLGCKTLYSKDTSHVQSYDGVVVCIPSDRLPKVHVSCLPTHA